MNSRHDQFVEGLLNQMPQLNSEQYTRYRRDLDARLAQVRQDEKTTRWLVVAAWAAAFAVCGAAAFLSARYSEASQGKVPESLLLAVATVTLLTPVAALILLALYLFKYRRKVTLADRQRQEAALGELQRQLNDLRAQMLPASERQEEASSE